MGKGDEVWLQEWRFILLPSSTQTVKNVESQEERIPESGLFPTGVWLLENYSSESGCRGRLYISCSSGSLDRGSSCGQKKSTVAPNR